MQCVFVCTCVQCVWEVVKRAGAPGAKRAETITESKRAESFVFGRTGVIACARETEKEGHEDSQPKGICQEETMRSASHFI